MISGMRVRRRSAFPTGGYKFYRLWVTANQGNTTRIAEFNLVTADNPDGVPSGGTPDAPNGPTNAERAFDGSPGTYWTILGTQYDLPHWISYEFPTPQKVTAYRIQARNVSNDNIRNPPTAWLFQASRNGVDWETLDTQSGLTWTSGQIREFPL